MRNDREPCARVAPLYAATCAAESASESAHPLSASDPLSPTPEPAFVTTPEARRQCAATSKRTGLRCGQTPPPGYTVCKWHGGGAPQVKRTAKERLEALADPALHTLNTVIRNGVKMNETPSAVRASLGVLDRIGLHPKSGIELTGLNGAPMQVESTPIPLEELPLSLRRLIVEHLESLPNTSASTPASTSTPTSAASADAEETL